MQSLRRDQTVLVSGGPITAVRPAQSIHIPPEMTMIDARGKFLIPGLWDMHTHLLADDRFDHQPGLYVATA